MGNFTVELHDKQGHPRNWDFPWCLYAAFAEAENTALVRIGISSKVYDRLRTISEHCPYIVGVTLWAPVGTRSRAQRIETTLRETFAARRTSNNWHRFDMKSLADKTAFHAATKIAYAAHTGGDLAWKKITPEMLKAYSDLKK